MLHSECDMKQQGITSYTGDHPYSQLNKWLLLGPVRAESTPSVFPGHYRSSAYSLQPHYFFVPASISMTSSTFPHYIRVVGSGKGRLADWFGDKV